MQKSEIDAYGIDFVADAFRIFRFPVWKIQTRAASGVGLASEDGSSVTRLRPIRISYLNCFIQL